MKTSVIEVRDMLSVLSVAGVEKRIGKVGGVESVTVNHAAGNATVRYDETRLDIADIKADVRQSGYDEASAPAGGSAAPGHDAQAAPSAIPDAAPQTPPGANGAAGAAPSGSPPAEPSAPASEPSASAKPPSPASGAAAAGATPPAPAAAAPDSPPPGDASKGKAAHAMS